MMRLFAVLLLGVPIALAADAPAALACPAAAREFLRVSIYNGKPGGEEYELAPDDETTAGRKITQTWFLNDYRSVDIFVRCRYRGTNAVTTLDVPAKYQKCTFTFELDKKNNITGKPEFSCR